MTSDRDHDPILRRLNHLPPLQPDDARAERIRTRCRTALARPRHQVAPSRRDRRFTALVIERVLVGGFCVIYLAAVIHDSLRVYGF